MHKCDESMAKTPRDQSCKVTQNPQHSKDPFVSTLALTGAGVQTRHFSAIHVLHHSSVCPLLLYHLIETHLFLFGLPPNSLIGQHLLIRSLINHRPVSGLVTLGSLCTHLQLEQTTGSHVGQEMTTLLQPQLQSALFSQRATSLGEGSGEINTLTDHLLYKTHRPSQHYFPQARDQVCLTCSKVSDLIHLQIL